MKMTLAIRMVKDSLDKDHCLRIMLPEERAVDIWHEDIIEDFYGLIEIKKERTRKYGGKHKSRVLIVPSKIVLMTVNKKEVL